ncbi:MAG: hypothetical protein ACP5NF_07750 [Thermoanaerobaculum sp.]
MLVTGLILIALVAAATLIGGVLPLRFREHSRVFLAFSAGTLVGLALGELIPEGLEAFDDAHLVLAAFVVTMALDKLHILHPHPHGLDACCPPRSIPTHPWPCTAWWGFCSIRPWTAWPWPPPFAKTWPPPWPLPWP